jgi:hypothetical protein
LRHVREDSAEKTYGYHVEEAAGWTVHVVGHSCRSLSGAGQNTDKRRR